MITPVSKLLICLLYYRHHNNYHGVIMSSPDQHVLKEIASELVQIESFPPRHVDVPSVWVVRFGIGGRLYQLMYDNEYVAEGITGALQALIYEAIGRYQILIKGPPSEV